MKRKIQLLPSGIPLVDNAWGGFYVGGTYLLIGQKKSGRSLLGLQFAYECVKQKGICLYLTSSRPKELMINAASIDFDLQYHMQQNSVILVKVAVPEKNSEKNQDDSLAEFFKDIIPLIEQYQPAKLVFDELTPFIEFNNLKYLQEVFLEATEKIEDSGVTSLLILSDPAVSETTSIVETLVECATGIIYLQKYDDREKRINGGKMIITPNIGHAEGQFSSDYIIEPYRGIVTDYKKSYSELLNHRFAKKEEKYKSLAEIVTSAEKISFSNLYNANDFNLVLNNQLAKFKTTGEPFYLVSFRLNPEAEKHRLISMTQLQNTVRLSIEKKDKICVINNKIIILIAGEDPKNLLNLIAKIKSNMPIADPDYLNRIFQHILVYTIQVEERFGSGEEMIAEIISETDNGSGTDFLKKNFSK
ncbi:MAG TPA: ATPase domain-containing protein [Ignavibacteriaceae bacterium]|nr:ATPase domain-containing protein [Ignavibacteriaceae bacterium]